MKLYGSLQNRILENKKNKEIRVGIGVTQYLYSDRYAFYVDKITKCNKAGEPVEIEIIRAKVECINYFAGDWKVYPYEETEKNACRRTLKRTRPDKNGNRFWTYSGLIDDIRFGIGLATEYQDPSF